MNNRTVLENSSRVNSLEIAQGQPLREGVADETTGPERSPPEGGCAPSLSIGEQLGQRWLTTREKNSAEKCFGTINELVRKHGSRVLELTLTFHENLTDYREASRRWDSFRRGVLDRRGYGDWCLVMERQERGAVHYHAAVVAADTPGYLGKWGRRVTVHPSDWLKRESRLLQMIATKYGFGSRVSLNMIRKNGEAFGRYLAGYLCKGLGSRRDGDRGARLWRSSKGANIGTLKFTRCTVGAELWRDCVRTYCEARGFPSTGALSVLAGPQWAYRLGDAIRGSRPELFRSQDHVRLWFEWQGWPGRWLDDVFGVQ